MPKTLIQSSLSREKQVLFLNDIEINGVQSVHVDYRNNLTPVPYIGMNRAMDAMRGIPVGTVGISLLAITSDQLLPYTGYSTYANGAVFKPNTAHNFSFEQAYMTNYNFRYSYGQLPQIDASFTAFSDVGNISSETVPNIFNQSTGTLKICGPGCASINLGEFQTNRLLSYEMSIGINRTPIYLPGLRTPVEVKTSLPIEVIVSLQFEVNDYDAYRQFMYPTNDIKRDVNFAVADYRTNEQFIVYNWDSMHFFSESYDINQNGNAVIAATYKKFLV